MKTVILVLALVAAACAVGTERIPDRNEMDRREDTEHVQRICGEKTDKVESKDGKLEYIEVREKETVKLQCPFGQRSLCTWYHEDREIPMFYGDWTITTKGNLLLKRAKVEHSGTYQVAVNGKKYIYHLAVRPLAAEEDLYDELTETRKEIRDKKIENKYLYNSNVKNLRFTNVELTDLHLHKVEFEYVTFVNVTFRWTKKLPTRVHFYKCNFINVRWENPNIVSSQFRNCKWTNDDETRVTFKNPCIRDTIFCDNWWTNTRWEDGEVFNTTFIKTTFKEHTWQKTKFVSYYVGKVNCVDIKPEMIVVDWELSGTMCVAYVFMPKNEMSKQCDYLDKKARRMCHFYPSVKFWDCTLSRSRVKEAEIRAVEWHRTRFDRCMFRDTKIDETYFMACNWCDNVMDRVDIRTFVKFLANRFRSDRLMIRTSTALWFHSCRMYDFEMRWEMTSSRIHFEYCIGKKVRFYGKHLIYRLIRSTMENIRFDRMTVNTLEYCNAYLREWYVMNTEIRAVKEVCDGNYITEYCGNTWFKAESTTKGDGCTVELKTWCKKDYNIRHPVCYPFTRSMDEACCATKGNWNCEIKPSTWRWWKDSDFKCKDEQKSRMGDDRDLDRRDRKSKVFTCIDRHLRLTRSRYNLWVREFKPMNSTLIPREFFTKFETPRDLMKIEMHRRICEDMEEGERRRECMTEVHTKGELYEREDRLREEEKGLIDPFTTTLELNFNCIKY